MLKQLLHLSGRAHAGSKVRRSASITRQHLPRLWTQHIRPATTSAALVLRDYQEDCIQSVLSHVQQGHNRLGVSLATGSGKTVIFTQLIDRLPPPNHDAVKALILVHRRELVEQAAEHCTRAYPDKRVEIEMGSNQASGHADITVASVQSLVSSNRIDKFNPKELKLLLVDEAHHIVAPSYLRVLEHFGLRSANRSQCTLVGVSATMSRLDGLKLGAAIDQIVYHKDYVDMIEAQWLSNVVFTTVKSNADLSKVRTSKGGDFQAGSLSRAVNTDDINDITVGAWRSEAGDRQSTIVFCVDIKHVRGLTSAFRKHGVNAQYITSDTRAALRAERLAAFKNGEFPVLINCGIFTEGTDIPNIDCVLLARPTKSRNLLVQMIGRGMRLFSGKQDCHVIDMVGSLETGIMTVPTLFGLEPSEVVRKAGPEEFKAILEKKRDELQAQIEQSMEKEYTAGPDSVSRTNITLTMTKYDSVTELIDDTSGERHIRAMSNNAWVHVGQDRYVLTSTGGIVTIRLREHNDENVKIDKSKDAGTLYEITWTRKLPEHASSKFAKRRVVGNASTLADAVRGADTFAAGVLERTLILSSAEWRKRPASDGQLKVLNDRLGLGDAGEQLHANNVSKGKAFDMITKLKHGAAGRFAWLQGQKRKVERMEAQLDNLRARERVEVGPLAR